MDRALSKIEKSIFFKTICLYLGLVLSFSLNNWIQNLYTLPLGIHNYPVILFKIQCTIESRPLGCPRGIE